MIDAKKLSGAVLAVVLHGPGLVDPSAFGVTAAEEPAGRGYVVVSIDHPGETVLVDLPSGPRPIGLPGFPHTDRR
ncbi:hypothetical protein ACFXGA_33040 [Actinosynnema sp. NPDC059335]|uniref:hypothetical protein n=1 Tax=Actinosynnema sp. NPDC059335 TaxID=3346804 RepID=UPI00366DB1AF